MALGEFRDNIGSVTGQKPVTDATIATALHRARAEESNDDLLGIASRNKSGIQNKGAALAKSVSESRQKQEERARKSMDDFIFTDMINRINDLNKQLGDIRANIKTLDAELRAEYGEDYMEVMAQTYLSDEELETLDGLNPAQRKKRIEDMLRDKMLDENGVATDQYKGLKIAELMEEIEKEEKVQTRVEKLEAAQETGDLEVIKKAIADDEVSAAAGRNFIAHGADDRLKGTFKAASETGDQATAELGNAIENRDVEENVDVAATFDNLESYGMG